MGNGVMVSRTEAAVRKVCYSHRKPKTTAPVFDSTRIEEKDRTNSDLKKIFSMAIFQKLFNMEE